jgi:hypothetical protein
MRTKLMAGIAVLLLAVMAYAGDPWKDKSYDQWTQADLEAVMFHSPWAQTVQVETSWKKDNASTDANRAGSERAPGGAGSFGSTPQQATNDPNNPSSSMASRNMGPSTTFVVRWSSALVERQALTRNAVLSGQMSAADAEKALADPQNDYQVYVGGQDMTPFQTATEDSLKSSTFLKLKKSRAKIAPSKVELIRDGDKVMAVLFSFPKKDASGAATIPPDEKGVQFSCSVMKANIHADFEPPHMTAKQGVDL